jgi:hypothetical protein
VNTKGSNSFLDCCNIVNGYTGCISVASLRFVPNKLSLNLVIFVLSVGGMLAAFWASIWS